MPPAIDADSVDPTELDLSLLAGFRFGCRPDCGLCCFTSPRVLGDDEQRLTRAVPGLRVIVHDGARCIPARPDGGACRLLQGLRCSAHGARPSPCREFPVSVHVGARLQATAVLSCPGLSLGALRSPGSWKSLGPPVGLDSEVEAARQRASATAGRLRSEAIRRRRKIVRELSGQGRWMEDDEVRARLDRERLIPRPEEFAPSELPTAGPGLERLPMYFDGRAGPVALARTGATWEALELSPDGGSRSIGFAIPAEAPPELEPEAEQLLGGYLRYWLARDGFLAAVHLDMMGATGGTVEEVARLELRAIGSDVLTRAAVRAQLHGDSGVRLTAAEVELGVRATDQDWLDRPTWGGRL